MKTPDELYRQFNGAKYKASEVGLQHGFPPSLQNTKIIPSIICCEHVHLNKKYKIISCRMYFYMNVLVSCYDILEIIKIIVHF